MTRTRLTAIAATHMYGTGQEQGMDPTNALSREREQRALSALDGLTTPEGAAVLGISSVAFRLRLSRARRALRRHVESATADDRLPGDLASDRSSR